MNQQAAGYRWYVGDLRTGKISRSVDLTGGRWAIPFDGPGSIEGAFPLGSGGWPNARADAAVAKSFIAVAYVDGQGVETFLEGGPLWSTRYTRSNGELSLAGAGLWTYFDHRKLLPILEAGQSAASVALAYSGSLALIAKRLVQEAQTHTGGELPIVFPADGELAAPGDPNVRNYPGYELGWVGERLRQLTEVLDGPEIQFVPRRRTDDPRFIEWVMQIGTAATDGMIYRSGTPHIVDASAPHAPMRELTITATGAAMAERVWAAGQGEAEGRPIVSVDDESLLALGYPLLEAETTATDTTQTTENLTSHAMESLAQSARPVETWQVVISRDGHRNVGLIRPGDWAMLRLANDPYIPDGKYQMRVTNLSGGETDITLDLSPRLGEV